MANASFSKKSLSSEVPVSKITPMVNWDELRISDELKVQFNDIKNWLQSGNKTENVRVRKLSPGQGYRALFYGPPGAGKSAAAGLLGRELNKEVYKVDLSVLISKYIGETEKNLELLFKRAEDKGWILFFDEADALFGKRTDVKDSHDRYSNQEVAYLLERIEKFNGLVVLATNKRSNIDDSYISRFDSVVEFPGTDEKA